jgi:membrane-bound lytic murein transglycosylase D
LILLLPVIGCQSSPPASSVQIYYSPTQEQPPPEGVLEESADPENVSEDSEIAGIDAVAIDLPQEIESENLDGPDVARDMEADQDPGELDHDRILALLQDSLEAYESADIFWKQGNFEDAFAALDRAYELMAEAPLNGDPLIAQEKEDLRHLISRRVIEIYASRQTAVGDIDRSIPMVLNEYVEREIKSFQGPERTFFLESYVRSGLYRPMILEELKRAGLPEQISWLPLVESGFKVRALSRARALGLWQFISSTGYRYGLERSWWIDERMDPVKSTVGAIGYLTDLHNLFGDWLTALAGYNCGERNVLRGISSQREGYFDQFWDIYTRLPRETRRYVPRFLAVLQIIEDPSAYGFDLPEPLPPLEWETLEIERSAELTSLDKVLGLEAGTLAALNPELRRKATPTEPYEVKVPRGQSGILLASLDQVPEWDAPSTSYTVHRVRSGETLSGIASRYGTSVRTLMDMNRLRSANRIWPGQQLQVPEGRPRATYASNPIPPGQEIQYSVRRGDSLWLLASRYGTTIDRIKRDNNLSTTVLRPGQTLRIRSASAAPSGGGGGTYVVQRGDTLGRIAQRQGVSLSRLMSVNGLSRRSTIYPGQRLSIPN